MHDQDDVGGIPPTKKQGPSGSRSLIANAGSSDLVGEILDGRFQIEKDLSDSEGADKGGIGLIYIAKDLKLLGKEVVVKILKTDSLENPDILRKFLHEKEALIRLEHPNIVRILDSGTLSDGNPFIVMEFIAGVSLRKVLRERGRLPLAFVGHVIESVAEALAAAHSQKILHRDIKPENIMLTPHGHGFEHVRVIDFGVARVEESQLAPMTEVVRGIGTVLYMAPEQLVGTIAQTRAVDVYSLAIVAYEMLTSQRPFEPQSTVEMYVLQKEGVKTLPTSLRDDVPQQVEDLLLSALEFEPEKRPQDIRLFGRLVSEALRGSPEDQDAIPTLKPHLAPTEAFEPVAADLVTKESLESRQNVSVPDTADHLPAATSVADAAAKVPYKLIGGLVAAAALLLVIIAIPVGYLLLPSGGDFGKTDANTASQAPGVGELPQTDARGPDTSPEVESPVEEQSGASRELSYFFDIQRMENESATGPMFRSAGSDVFKNGDKFRLNFQSDAEGFLYMFSDDADADGGEVFNILYPTPSTNEGSPKVARNSSIKSTWNTFSGQGGSETVWMIWTSESHDELESARELAFENLGRVTETGPVGALRTFIDEHKVPAPQVEKDGIRKTNIIRGRGDVVIYRLELQHW
jgi:serine/threonine-protein kinase